MIRIGAITIPYVNVKEDVAIVTSVIILVTILRYFLDKYILNVISLKLLKHLFQSKNTDKKHQEEFDDLRHKFETSLWKTFIYTMLVGTGAYLVRNESFVKDQLAFWRGWPQNIDIPLSVRLFYLLELGYYIQATIAFHYEPHMKDRVELMIHHICTICLISCSYLTGFWRIGVAMMLLHDVSDPFLELAKLFLYRRNVKLANIVFFTFAHVFIYTRCYIFPKHIIYPSYFIAKYHVDLSQVRYLSVYVVYFFSLLAGLQLLHLIWATMIIKMAFHIIATGGHPVRDVREEKTLVEETNTTEGRSLREKKHKDNVSVPLKQ